MPSPRFHPLVRLLICVSGVIFAVVVVMSVITAAVVTASLLNGLSYAEQATQFFETQALLVTLLFYPSILLWLWFCRRALDRRSFVSLGLRPRHGVRDFAAGLCGGAAAISFLVGCLWVTGHVAISPWSSEAFEAGPLLSVGMLCLWALACLAIGFMEEISFRGYLLHNLAAWRGFTAAAIVQAIFFAAVHLSNVLGPVVKATGFPDWAALTSAFWDIRWGLLNIGLIGLFFALAYLKTGSLWFPIGFHAAWNFFLGSIFSMPVSGLKVFRLFETQTSTNSLLTGGSFGAEGSVLLVAINVAMIYLVRRYPDHPQATLDLNLLSAQPVEVPLEAATSVPQAEPTAGEENETSHTPRFKTTMRGRETDISAADEFLSQVRGASAPTPPSTTPFQVYVPALPRDEPLDEEREVEAAAITPSAPKIAEPATAAPLHAESLAAAVNPPPAPQPEPLTVPPSSSPPPPAPPTAPPPVAKPPAPRW